MNVSEWRTWLNGGCDSPRLRLDVFTIYIYTVGSLRELILIIVLSRIPYAFNSAYASGRNDIEKLKKTRDHTISILFLSLIRWFPKVECWWMFFKALSYARMRYANRLYGFQWSCLWIIRTGINVSFFSGREWTEVNEKSSIDSARSLIQNKEFRKKKMFNFIEASWIFPARSSRFASTPLHYFFSVLLRFVVLSFEDRKMKPLIKLNSFKKVTFPIHSKPTSALSASFAGPFHFH